MGVWRSYVDKEETLEVLGRVLDEFGTVRVEYAGVPVVLVWILACSPRRGVELDAGGGDSLERSQCESSGLKGICWSHELRSNLISYLHH
jgi:hypothetical protein